MWREYTRETPARPGLALIMAAVALVGTTALAWLVTQRINPQVVYAINYWPIRFSLPEQFRQNSLEQVKIGSEWIEGNEDVALFNSGTTLDPTGYVVVRYKIFDSGADLNEASVDLLGEALVNSQPVNIGPIDGQIMETATPRGAIRLLAVGLTPEGLAISLEYLSTRFSAADFSRFQRICESVEFKDWYTPVPPWITASRKSAS